MASEIILAKAHTRGLPVSIYRPGWIVGHSKTGICAIENNHLLLLLKSCIQMGYAPRLDVKLNLLPVDFVSNFIVQASLNYTKNDAKVFNMINKFPTPWFTLLNFINKHISKITKISPDQWSYYHLNNIGPDNALYPLISLYLMDGGISWAKVQKHFSKINISHTLETAKKLKINHIKIDKVYLKNFFNYMQKIEFI